MELVQVKNITTRGEGAYRSGAFSGLIAGVAAGTTTNGHIWAARYTGPITTTGENQTQAVIQRLRVRAFTIAGYTTAQEVRLAVFRLTGYTAGHSGGTGAVALTPTPKKTGFPATRMTGRISGSDQLTAGTQTLSTEPIAVAAYAELAAAATVPKGQIDILISTEDLTEHPIILAADEGLLVRNEVGQGAAGTMRLVVEMDWLEVARY